MENERKAKSKLISCWLSEEQYKKFTEVQDRVGLNTTTLMRALVDNIATIEPLIPKKVIPTEAVG